MASVLSEYFKSSERTIFWDEDLRANVDPFEGLDSGFFATDWDFKECPFVLVKSDVLGLQCSVQLKILRQLVELQLSHSPDIKATIDRAWGVVHNKHKKKDATTAPPGPDDPKSQERLQLTPIGQDSHRKRFWIADGPCTIVVFLFACICLGTCLISLALLCSRVLPSDNSILNFVTVN